MKISIITLFPEMFKGVLNNSMMLKAQKNNLTSFDVINLRDYGLGKRKTVDDSPYGGGDGMLLRPEPLFSAVEAAKIDNLEAKVLLMTPRGKIFKQSDAKKYADTNQNLIIICGRYEGYDERIVELVDESISIGKYVMTGGEIPAMAISDAIVRLIPGVLGGEKSAEIESYSGNDPNEIEYPQYTRPEVFRDLIVPDVLLSGNHKEIADWRKQQSLDKTQELS